jgi:hypothetical protein
MQHVGKEEGVVLVRRSEYLQESLYTSKKEKHNHYAITKPCVCPSPSRRGQAKATREEEQKVPSFLLLSIPDNAKTIRKV